MEEIISKLVKEGIIIKVKDCKREPNTFGDIYVPYDISEDYLCIYNFKIIIKTYIEKYVHNKLEMISLFDDYNEYHVDIEEFKSDVKIYKKENLISEI